MTKRRPIPRLTEWEIAMIAAQHYWRGSSISDGAIAILHQAHKKENKP